MRRSAGGCTKRLGAAGTRGTMWKTASASPPSGGRPPTAPWLQASRRPTRPRLAVLYAAEGQFWGAVPSPGGCRRRPQPGQPAPPAEAGRSPLEHSHEESSWCSWRPLEWRARADGGGGGVLLAPHRAPSVRTGVPHRGVACTRSEPRALGAKCSVTLALERDTMGNPRFLCTRSPNGRGLAPIGTGQHQICLVRPFLRRKAIFFWVLWAP